MRAALGLRAHSGWAALVVVAGTSDKPQVLERRRIETADSKVEASRSPYHAAAELPLTEAEALVRNAVASARSLAEDAVAAAVTALRARGHEIVACGILLGSGKTLPDLEKILASHTLIHTAEGELFRDVLHRAAAQQGLPVAGIREKDVDASSLARIASLGRLIGPPWTQDQKLATVAALKALESTKVLSPKN